MATNDSSEVLGAREVQGAVELQQLHRTLDRLTARVRGRVALGAAARAGSVILVLAGLHAFLGGAFSTAGIALLLAAPVAAFCAAWSTVLPGEARAALAKALDSQLASEDRLPSALDSAIAALEHPGAALVREEAAALTDELPAAARRIAPFPWKSLRWVPLGAALLAAGLVLAPEPRPVEPEPGVEGGDVLPDEVLSGITDILERASDAEEGKDPTETDPLEDLKRKVSEAEMTPSEALLAAAEAMEAMERERADIEEAGDRLDALAKAMEQFEEMQDLAQAIQERRMEDARRRIREMREEIEEEERKILQKKSKGEMSEEEARKELENIEKRKRRLDELSKAMRDYGQQLMKMNRQMDAAREMGERVRYAQRSPERERYRKWLEEQQQGGGGRQGPRRLGGRQGGDANGARGGDDWGRGTGNHEGSARRTSVRTVLEKVAAEEGEGGITRFFVASDNDGSKSKIDYQQLVAEFERRALEAVYTEEVPVTFRRYVKDYFDKVKPTDE